MSFYIYDSRHNLPFRTELDDADMWKRPETFEWLFDLVVAIIKRGFSGIEINVCDTTPSRGYVGYRYNTATPEGRLLEALWYLARNGNSSLSEQQVIEILERVYREQNIPLPKKGARK